MLDETREKIKNAFVILCPEIQIEAEQLDVYIDLIEPMLSERVFGKLYVTAFVYLMAHHIVLRKLIDVDDGGSGVGSASIKLTAGSITSEREGDLQRSYGSAGGGSSGNGSGTDMLEKTYYGIEFKRIRSMCLISVVTRLDTIV